MREFCELVWDEPIFGPERQSAVMSNIDGKVTIFADSDVLADNLLEILQNSSARKQIPDESSGMERIVCNLYGVGGRYSSDNRFTEREFNTLSKQMKATRSFTA